MAQAELRKVWEDRIAAYRASGQKAAEWCAAQQVTTRQLWYWMKKLKNTQTGEASASQWVAVHVDKKTEAEETPLLVKVGSVAIEVRPGFNPSLLSDVVRTLQALW